MQQRVEQGGGQAMYTHNSYRLTFELYEASSNKSSASSYYQSQPVCDGEREAEESGRFKAVTSEHVAVELTTLIFQQSMCQLIGERKNRQGNMLIGSMFNKYR